MTDPLLMYCPQYRETSQAYAEGEERENKIKTIIIKTPDRMNPPQVQQFRIRKLMEAREHNNNLYRKLCFFEETIIKEL